LIDRAQLVADQLKGKSLTQEMREYGYLDDRSYALSYEATIAQIDRCVAAGGERAVLCADGHKSYAQPIGDLVAYTDKISPSGVGFDIACGNLAHLHRGNAATNRVGHGRDHE